MVLIALCFLAALIGFILQMKENGQINPINPVPKKPASVTALKPEYNKELREMIADLEKKAARLQKLSSEGMELYNGLPAGLKECEKLKTLDDSNWALFGAQTHIETAISRIKDAMI